MPSINISGSGGDGGVPSLKFPYSKVGDCTADIGLVDAVEQQATDFRTGEPKLTQSGKPKMEWVVTGIVVSGGYTENEIIADPAKGVGPDDARPPVAATPGETVKLYVGSYNKYSPDDPNHVTWSVAADRLGGSPDVGDLLQVAFNRTVAVGDGLSARKVLDFAWRRYDAAKDGDLQARCLEAHRELHSTPVNVGATPAPAPAATGAPLGEDAF